MGLSAELAGSAVRFSLGRETTEQDIDLAGAIVGRIIDRISTKSRTQKELQGAAS